MKRHRIFIQSSIFALLLGIWGCMNARSLKPVALQCEYQTNPTGIGVERPRLSWQLSDPQFTRGQRQTAFHVLVATRPELLTEAKADVWNSGKLDSDRSQRILFAGKALASNRAYYWKVKLFDKDGMPTPWSESARFVTGILNPSEWDDAAWIRHPSAPAIEHIWFRKKFTLDSKPENVFANVASLGYHELYVNGRKVDDRVLAPALTDFQKRLFYVTYDIAPLLTKGENIIAVYSASGWATYDCFHMEPCLKVKVSGSNFTMASDETWRCAVSNSHDTCPVKSFGNNGGECIDVRKAEPGWNTVDYNDSSWVPASITERDIALVAHDIPASRIIDSIPAQKITDIGDGTYKIDFGKNFTGWLNLRFHGLQAGDTITIGSADDDKEFGDFNIINYFVSAGGKDEQFENRFNYIAGRYANIKGLRQKPTESDFTAYPISTDLQRSGQFQSSDELFNRIYETDLWTFLANTQEGYTSDCPHRERCGYGEVATATSWGIGLPNFDAGSFYRNVVQNWCDVQTDDGWGRDVAPQPNNDHWGGPMWCSGGMNVAEHHYQHYGDIQVIEQIYPSAKRWLEFLHSHVKDGLLEQYHNYNPGHFLGDWLAPGSRNEFGNSIQAKYFNNCVYAMNIRTFVKFANLLGHPDDASKYTARLDSLLPAIHTAFYRADSATYCTGTQVQNAFALWVGLTPENERARVEATLINDMQGAHPYFDMGSSGLIPLLKFLVARPEYAETVAAILKRTEYPGYGYFISEGETTWPEDWVIDVPSKIHTCYTGIAGWLVKGLCGIRPDEEQPGYRSILIKPFIIPRLEFAEASVLSPYGTIKCRWEHKGDAVTLSLTVPPGSEATIYVPTVETANIRESGQLPEKSEGVFFAGTREGCSVYHVVSGRYNFEY